MIKSHDSFMKGYILGNKLGTPDRAMSRFGQGFRARAASSITGGPAACIRFLVQVDEAKTRQLFHSCGIQKKVLVTMIGGAYGYCGGVFFNARGMLCSCAVKGKYTWKDDRHFGLYDYKNCTFISTSGVTNYRPNAIMSPYYHIYYDKAHADLYDPDYDCLVFAWDKPWVTSDGSAFSTSDFPFYSRSKGSKTWSTGTTTLSNGFSESTSGASSLSYVDKNTVEFLF